MTIGRAALFLLFLLAMHLLEAPKWAAFSLSLIFAYVALPEKAK